MLAREGNGASYDEAGSARKDDGEQLCDAVDKEPTGEFIAEAFADEYRIEAT